MHTVGDCTTRAGAYPAGARPPPAECRAGCERRSVPHARRTPCACNEAGKAAPRLPYTFIGELHTDRDRTWGRIEAGRVASGRALCAGLASTPAQAVLDNRDRGHASRPATALRHQRRHSRNAFFGVGLSNDPRRVPDRPGDEALNYAVWVERSAPDDPGFGRPAARVPAHARPDDHVHLADFGWPGAQRFFDDDGDGRVDEEILNGVDDDGDGETDDLGSPPSSSRSPTTRTTSPKPSVSSTRAASSTVRSASACIRKPTHGARTATTGSRGSSSPSPTTAARRCASCASVSSRISTPAPGPTPRVT